MRDHLIGVDIGGTKTECCLIHLPEDSPPAAYQVLISRRCSTDPPSGLSAFLARLNALVDRILEETGLSRSRIRATGIGLPGTFDPISGRMARGSIPFLDDVPLVQVLESALGDVGPIILENDANCFALAEAKLGAGADWALGAGVAPEALCMIGVTLGTGVGGGIIMNGALVRGKRGGAGEIGHSTLFPDGRPCYCGKLGCAEQYLSGGGFEASYSVRTSHRERSSAREIFRLVEEGNPFALSAFESYRDDLTTFLSNLSNLLDPHVIVLGGGMSTQERLYPGLVDRLRDACFLTQNPPPILKHRIGDSAGMIGAALLAHQKGTP